MPTYNRYLFAEYVFVRFISFKENRLDLSAPFIRMRLKVDETPR